ncbi:hypothetical protein [Ligilactobacillus agilis]
MDFCFYNLNGGSSFVIKKLLNICGESKLLEINKDVTEFLKRSPPRAIIFEAYSNKEFINNLAFIKRVRESLPYTFFIICTKENDNTLRLCFENKLKVLDIVNLEDSCWEKELRSLIKFVNFKYLEDQKTMKDKVEILEISSSELNGDVAFAAGVSVGIILVGGAVVLT